MATDKKSFLLYCDLIHTVEKLDDEHAGELFKHILRYVNDQNPTPKDFIIDLAFEPIKQILKRDLRRYESIIERNRTNGVKGGRPLKDAQKAEPKKPIGLFGNPKNPDEPKKADIDIDIDIDSDIDSDTPKEEIFDFKKSFLELGVKKQYLDDWLKVRKAKKGSNTKTAFEGILRKIEASGLTPNECIKIAAERGWNGFDPKWLNDFTPKNNGTKVNTTIASASHGSSKNYLEGAEDYFGAAKGN